MLDRDGLDVYSLTKAIYNDGPRAATGVLATTGEIAATATSAE
jgi:hypothetical protein